VLGARRGRLFRLPWPVVLKQHRERVIPVASRHAVLAAAHREAHLTGLRWGALMGRVDLEGQQMMYEPALSTQRTAPVAYNNR